jgi:hypothetical protein
VAEIRGDVFEEISMLMHAMRPAHPGFMFATGIENSVPTINGGRVRVDQMDSCGHYQHWRTDFDLVQDLGISFLRYGPPIHTTFLGKGRYDWSFADETFRRSAPPRHRADRRSLPFRRARLDRRLPEPGFPDAVRRLRPRFRGPLSRGCSSIRRSTRCTFAPVFSARYGWWNEQLTTDRGFVTALKHIVTANVRAMQSILEVRPDAIFIQSESSEYFHADDPAAIRPAEIMNSSAS